MQIALDGRAAWLRVREWGALNVYGLGWLCIASVATMYKYLCQ